MGDGEQDEGSVWEAVMGAAHHRLDNLIAILDRNFLQIDGNTEEVMRLEPLADKYRAFGWNVLEIDGHDLSAILEAFQAAVDHVGSPTVILATTVKGQGVSYTANACGYHGVPPKDGLCGPESLETAVCDLGVEDVLTPERRARVLAAVARYQEAVDAYVEARLPRFAHDYWWNHGETMQVEMDATRNGYGRALATHQALEEIALISILPHFTMVVPCDAIETEKATRAIAEIRGPAVVRYAREATPVVTSPATPFVLGQANVTRLRRESESFLEAFDTVLASDYQNEHEDLAIIACGPMVPEAMRAAVILKHEYGLETRIVNVHTVKPLDAAALAAAGREIGVILTAEEHQVGGFGNRVAAALCEADLGRELRFRMIGVRDTFGETGQPWELIKLFGLSAEHLAHTAAEMLGKL